MDTEQQTEPGHICVHACGTACKHYSPGTSLGCVLPDECKFELREELRKYNAEYLGQLKEMTDEIRKKDPSKRTYEERWYLWQEKVMTDPPDAPFDCGEEREFYDGQSLANNEIKDGFGNDFPEWFREMGNCFGKKCTIADGKVYTLIGMSETFEDYYYILEGEDGRKTYKSCVGKVDFS